METSYVSIIQQVFKDRKRTNSNYSLRAFARDLEISPSTLSEILAGKKGLAIGRSRGVAHALRLPEWKISFFCDLVVAKHSKSPALRLEAKKRLETMRIKSPFRMLNPESSKFFASWLDMAILELTYLKDFEGSIEWVSKKLNVKEEIVQERVTHLQKGGFLKIAPETGKWSDVSAAVTTTDGVPSETIRELQKSFLRRASKKLDDPDLESRMVKSAVFSTTSENLPRAREILNDAICRIVALANEAPMERDQLVCFSAQFFSLVENHK